MKREEFFNVIASSEEYLLIDKENKKKNIKELLEFVDKIEFSQSDITNLSIDLDYMEQVKSDVEKYLEKDTRGVTNINNYREYGQLIQDLLGIIQICIPNNYFIENDKDKIIIKQVQAFWGR